MDDLKWISRGWVASDKRQMILEKLLMLAATPVLGKLVPKFLRKREKSFPGIISAVCKAFPIPRPTRLDLQGHMLDSVPYLEKWILMYKDTLIQIRRRGVSMPYFRISEPRGIDSDRLSMVEKVVCYLNHITLPENPRCSRPEPKDQCPRHFKGNTSRVVAFAHDYLIYAIESHPTFTFFQSEVLRLTNLDLDLGEGLKHFYWPLWASFMFPDIYGDWRWYENIVYQKPYLEIAL